MRVAKEPSALRSLMSVDGAPLPAVLPQELKWKPGPELTSCACSCTVLWAFVASSHNVMGNYQ